jgi:hypothetical protein
MTAQTPRSSIPLGEVLHGELPEFDDPFAILETTTALAAAMVARRRRRAVA